MKMLRMALSVLALCTVSDAWSEQRTLTVTATAYNATTAQTDGKPRVGAWGDRLDQLGKGLRAAAVSPDLVAQGLGRKQRFRIDGFKGEFVVLDRTPSKWKNRIDLFMGSDVAAARRFGKKSVKIHFSGTTPAKP